MVVEQTPTDKKLEAQIDSIKNIWKQIPELEISQQNLSHMAVICDGNRRSARAKGLKPYEGHRLGIETIRGVLDASQKWGIKNLTFWLWSTENWKRDETQVGFVMGMASRFLRDEQAIAPLIQHQVRFKHLGRKDRLPPAVGEAITALEQRTQNFDQHQVNVAIDYGGLDEVNRAMATMIESGVQPDQVKDNPTLIYEYLDTAGQPLPELVVRTGTNEGEVPHTSGFMPLQTTYSSWAFMPDLFPDLTPQSLAATIGNFLSYEMRKGK